MLYTCFKQDSILIHYNIISQLHQFFLLNTSIKIIYGKSNKWGKKYDKKLWMEFRRRKNKIKYFSKVFWYDQGRWKK